MWSIVKNENWMNFLGNQNATHMSKFLHGWWEFCIWVVFWNRVGTFQIQRENHVGLSFYLNKYLFPTFVSGIAFFWLFNKTLQCILQTYQPQKRLWMLSLSIRYLQQRCIYFVETNLPYVSTNVLRILLD